MIRTRNKMNEWISVEERLPESGEEVLIWYSYFRYGDYNAYYQTYGLAHYIEEYKGWYGQDASGTDFKVLYWAPLPKPPEM